MKLKNNVFSRIALFALCIASCLSFLLCACSAEPTSERVDENRLNKLRKQYPYNDASSGWATMQSDQSAFPTFEKWMGISSPGDAPKAFRAIVVLEPTGGWYQIGDHVDPFDDEALNEMTEQITPGISNMTWDVHNATIKEVLWSDCDLEPGDTIVLGFAAQIITYGMGLDKVYESGEQLVCFLFEPVNNFGVDNLMTTGKAYTFHLTKQDVLVSVTSAGGPDAYSGMYLHAFKTFVDTVIAPLKDPDAELTPVPPDVVQE